MPLDDAMTLYFSVVSAWEIAIKTSLGKLEVGVPLTQLLDDERARLGLVSVGIDTHHLVRVSRLPFHHHDPFDRLMAAQALVEDLDVLSPDRSFELYGLRRTW